MLQSYSQLVELLDERVIEGASLADVNAASVDLTLGNTFYVEAPVEQPPRLDVGRQGPPVISLRRRESPRFTKVVLEPGQPFIALPGAFFLACTQQRFNLPDDLSAEYKLRSHMARCGLNHMLAGWCDAGWHDSVLTLEFKNELQYSAIELMEGDPAGQIVCMRHLKVPNHASYAEKGRFNGDHSAQPTKE